MPSDTHIAQNDEVTDGVEAGLPEGPPPGRATAKGILSMQGVEPAQDEAAAKTLDRGEMRSVTAKVDREVLPPKSKRPTESQVEAYQSKVQGQIAEESLQFTGAESLNDFRPNAPVYDALLEGKEGFEAASVKTHMPSEKYPNAYLANYAHDLRVATGATEAERGKYEGMTGPAFAAATLNGLDKLPDALKDVPPDQMEMRLRENASLRIPANHVGPARAYLIEQASADPVLYGLPANAGAEEVQRLAERIKPLPVTSDQIAAAVERRREALTSRA